MFRQTYHAIAWSYKCWSYSNLEMIPAVESHYLLQRVAEDLEYRDLLDEAHQSKDPAERMALVAAFIASGYSATLSRESKPFNPLLGETFEWQPGDQSCRFLCEQVFFTFVMTSSKHNKSRVQKTRKSLQYTNV